MDHTIRHLIYSNPANLTSSARYGFPSIRTEAAGISTIKRRQTRAQQSLVMGLHLKNNN